MKRRAIFVDEPGAKALFPRSTLCASRWGKALLLLGLASLVACGGGGGGSGTVADSTGTVANPGNTPSTSPASYPPASSLAAQCAAPRTGTNPGTGQPYADRPGDVGTEKAWVRSWINDTYLWYDEVPDIPAQGYASAEDYFAVLKTQATTASGNLKDKFHFTYSTPDWLALSQSGVELGYGIDWSLLSSRPPRSIVVTQVTPGSVAAQAGIQRGATVLTVDGVDVANGADVATLNAGLFPSVAGSHRLRVQEAGASSAREVVLQAGPVTSVPVHHVTTLATASGPVGYLLFNDHIATAEAQLISAFTQLKAAQVVDLVLDMRYNGGGYLDIAAELAYMIAGPQATSGKTFERLSFNDKNPFNVSAADSLTPFHAQALGLSAPNGQPLPFLGLKRVYVLSSSRTCSASEAVVNGLRGVGVTVELVGGSTCGKPYGFFPQDNCGVTYFAIQFKGVNQLGFGDYADGFTPTCQAADDLSRPLGDPLEGQLAAALSYRGIGVCSTQGSAAGSSPAIASLQTKAGVQDAGMALALPLNPARNNRILR